MTPPLGPLLTVGKQGTGWKMLHTVLKRNQEGGTGKRLEFGISCFSCLWSANRNSSWKRRKRKQGYLKLGATKNQKRTGRIVFQFGLVVKRAKLGIGTQSSFWGCWILILKVLLVPQMERCLVKRLHKAERFLSPQKTSIKMRWNAPVTPPFKSSVDLPEKTKISRLQSLLDSPWLPNSSTPQW